MEDGRARTRSGLHALAALALSVVFLAGNIGRSGIWDPFELERAELGRRIAVALFGAEELRIDGALNGLPTLSDLGAGELGFTSIAWGFSAFGLHDWAGRLPLALWAVAGAMAVYAFVARFVSSRAALCAVLVLVTLPAYFVQARTMLGDAVSMAAFAAAFCGLAGAVLERKSHAVAIAFGLMGAAGAVAGYFSRGALVGVAAPLAGVGLGWLVLVGADDKREPLSWRAHGFGVACAVAAVVAIYFGAAPLSEPGAAERDVLRVVGFRVLAAAPEASFDRVIRDLGHALFPWSAFLPFAIGRLVWSGSAPLGSRPPPRPSPLRGEGELRSIVLVGCAATYAVHAYIAPYSGPIPFAGVALLAIAAAVAIDDAAKTPPPAIVGVGTLLLLVLLWRDLDLVPQRALAAYGLVEPGLPDKLGGLGWLHAIAAVFAGGVLLAWRDPPNMLSDDDAALGPDAGSAVRRWLRQRIEHYERLADVLATVWNGNLAFGFLVVEAGLIGLGAMLLVGGKAGWDAVRQMPLAFVRAGLNAWWALPLACLAIPVLLDLVRAGYAYALARARVTRAGGMLAAVLAAGALSSFAHYPGTMSALSPKEVFLAYRDHHGPGEPLGTLGLSARVGRYYSGGEQVHTLASTRAALRWLGEGEGRRWLVFRSAELAELNALHREAGRGNLPVIDARGDIMLACNQRKDEPDQNPLASAVLDRAPAHIQHPLQVMFSDKLEALGWEVTDERGALTDYVVPGQQYRLRFYYRVLMPLTKSYQAFLHIDGKGRRHNGDHDVVGGAYRMTWWRPGDVIADAYDLVLAPNFTPDDYALYFGFYAGGERLPVTRGKHHDNRVAGGMLSVR